MRGLIDSLILYERIETTEIKAKALAREFDKLVTKAKKSDLHNYRQVLATTINPVAAEKLLQNSVRASKVATADIVELLKPVVDLVTEPIWLLSN